MKKISVLFAMIMLAGLASCTSGNNENEEKIVVAPVDKIVETPIVEMPVVEEIVEEVIEDLISEVDENIQEVSDDSNQVEVKEFEMDSYTEMIDGNYAPKFSLTQIEVNKGDTVRIKINTTKGVHDFTLDEFDVFAETPEGEVTVVEFVAGEAGTFQYYCSKPNHRKNGHWGTIIVK